MEISAYILAGGKSTRFGEDKALVRVDGEMMLERIARAIRSCGIGTICIVGRMSNPTEFGLEAIPDKIEHKGPLGGLYTALLHSKTRRNLIISCDVPFIDSTFIQEFISASTSDSEISIAKTPDRTHPLLGIYSKEVLDKIQSNLSQNKLALHALLELSSVQYIDVTGFESYSESILANINTKEELEKWSQE